MIATADKAVPWHRPCDYCGSPQGRRRRCCDECMALAISAGIVDRPLTSPRYMVPLALAVLPENLRTFRRIILPALHALLAALACREIELRRMLHENEMEGMAATAGLMEQQAILATGVNPAAAREMFTLESDLLWLGRWQAEWGFQSSSVDDGPQDRPGARIIEPAIGAWPSVVRWKRPRFLPCTEQYLIPPGPAMQAAIREERAKQRRSTFRAV